MKILVVGDSCIDNFVYCNIDRLCPEAPVPVLKPLNTTSNPGMAANVARNLTALGVDVEMITNKLNIRKTRYVDNKSGQMIMRLDEEDKCDNIKTLSTQDVVMPNELLQDPDFDALIISDYCKGFLTEEDIESIINNCPCPVFIDTKKKLGSFVEDADFIKINKPEWDNNKEYEGDNVIITDGKNGAIYNDKVFPVKKEVNVSNVSGAGDTFLAALAFKYVEKGDIENAIDFANECASKVVQERGVTII